MSVNLNKNRESILSAYKDVLDGKTSTNWALYGYEGQSNDLKVIEKGDGGIIELTDELNSGKIMYAFISIKDPKTDLTKFCLINWQGEGAPTIRKGSCANHIHEIKKLLNGSHLTINARVEEDIDEDLILNKLKHVSSAYNFNQRHTATADDDKRKKPVGTVYKRCIPENEINSMERDKFWQREEEEERKRKEIENERKQLELLKAEEERRVREEKEHNERERIAVQTAAAAPLSLVASPQSPHYETPQSPISSPTAITNELLKSPSRSVTQAELWREQRKQEAKELIGSRVGTAKAIFAQNSSSGQMQNKTSAPTKPVRSSKSQGINNSEIDDNVLINNKHKDRLFNDEQSEYLQQKEFEEEEERLRQLEEKQQQLPNIDNQEQEEQQYSTIKRSPHNKSLEQDVTTPTTPPTSTLSPTAVTAPPTSILKNNDSKNQLIEDLINRKNDNESNNVQVDDTYQEFLTEDMGLKARALYDYQAADESEITFDPGDIITHIDQIDEGWWQGLGPDGTYGLFPANYVDIIP